MSHTAISPMDPSLRPIDEASKDGDVVFSRSSSSSSCETSASRSSSRQEPAGEAAAPTPRTLTHPTEMDPATTATTAEERASEDNASVAARLDFRDADTPVVAADAGDEGKAGRDSALPASSRSSNPDDEDENGGDQKASTTRVPGGVLDEECSCGSDPSCHSDTHEDMAGALHRQSLRPSEEVERLKGEVAACSAALDTTMETDAVALKAISAAARSRNAIGLVGSISMSGVKEEDNVLAAGECFPVLARSASDSGSNGMVNSRGNSKDAQSSGEAHLVRSTSRRSRSSERRVISEDRSAPRRRGQRIPPPPPPPPPPSSVLGTHPETDATHMMDTPKSTAQATRRHGETYADSPQEDYQPPPPPARPRRGAPPPPPPVPSPPRADDDDEEEEGAAQPAVLSAVVETVVGADTVDIGTTEESVSPVQLFASFTCSETEEEEPATVREREGNVHSSTSGVELSAALGGRFTSTSPSIDHAVCAERHVTSCGIADDNPDKSDDDGDADAVGDDGAIIQKDTEATFGVRQVPRVASFSHSACRSSGCSANYCPPPRPTTLDSLSEDSTARGVPQRDGQQRSPSATGTTERHLRDMETVDDFTVSRGGSEALHQHQRREQMQDGPLSIAATAAGEAAPWRRVSVTSSLRASSAAAASFRHRTLGDKDIGEWGPSAEHTQSVIRRCSRSMPTTTTTTSEQQQQQQQQRPSGSVSVSEAHPLARRLTVSDAGQSHEDAAVPMATAVDPKPIAAADDGLPSTPSPHRNGMAGKAIKPSPDELFDTHSEGDEHSASPSPHAPPHVRHGLFVGGFHSDKDESSEHDREDGESYESVREYDFENDDNEADGEDWAGTKKHAVETAGQGWVAMLCQPVDQSSPRTGRLNGEHRLQQQLEEAQAALQAAHDEAERREADMQNLASLVTALKEQLNESLERESQHQARVVALTASLENAIAHRQAEANTHPSPSSPSAKEHEQAQRREAEWHTRYDALAAELVAVKTTLAEQTAVLDRLGIYPPYGDALVGAASVVVTRPAAAAALATATTNPQDEVSTPPRPDRDVPAAASSPIPPSVALTPLQQVRASNTSANSSRKDSCGAARRKAGMGAASSIAQLLKQRRVEKKSAVIAEDKEN